MSSLEKRTVLPLTSHRVARVKVLETLDCPSTRNPTYHLWAWWLDLLHLQVHRRDVSLCISSTRLRSPHMSCLALTHTAWSHLPPPVLLYWPLYCRGASRPASCTLCRRFMVRPPECDGVFLWIWAVFETWPKLTRQKSSGLPSFLSLPFVGSDPIALRWHLIILGVRLIILRVSGAPCGPILMSHMWPVKKDPSDLPIRLITTQYILMSRVRSYTYNIHIHSTHAGIYICV